MPFFFLALVSLFHACRQCLPATCPKLLLSSWIGINSAGHLTNTEAESKSVASAEVWLSDFQSPSGSDSRVLPPHTPPEGPHSVCVAVTTESCPPYTPPEGPHSVWGMMSEWPLQVIMRTTCWDLFPFTTLFPTHLSKRHNRFVLEGVHVLLNSYFLFWSLMCRPSLFILYIN